MPRLSSRRFLAAVATLALAIAFARAECFAQEFSVIQGPDQVEVRYGDQLVTKYWTKSGAKPIFWPVIGPYGDPVTRSYPVGEPLPGEKQDHIHQRSFWFTHGNVNGVDFWSEGEGHGDINHQRFVEAVGGEQASIVTRNDWIGPDGAKICEDQRSFKISRLANNALAFDCEITVTAVQDKVVFGDTKEGSFGIRTAGAVDVDAKLGGKIVNSDGKTDKDAWGQRAAWVDYHGPIAGKVVGIAIMNHPTSFRFPTYWHVREYGLFAANPFGVHDFTGKADDNGAHAMAKGESFTLRYRVLVHPGDEQTAKLADAYEEYARSMP